MTEKLTCEGEEGEWDRDWNIYAHHSDIHFILEFSGSRPTARKDSCAIAMLVAVDQLQSLI